MSERQNIFFGAAMAFLVVLVVLLLPIHDNYKFVIVAGLEIISVLIYDNRNLFKNHKYKPHPMDDKDKDIKHLNWLYDRLKDVHKENPNWDYMLKLRKIIDNYK